MTADPRRLRDFHYTLAQLVAQGLSQKEVARQIGKSPRTVRSLVKSPLVQVLIQEERQKKLRPVDEQIVTQVFEALPEAVATTIQIMRESPHERTRLSAAATIIAMAGRVVRQFGRPEEDSETRIIFGVSDMQEMQALVDEAREHTYDATATNISMQPTEG